MRPASPTMRAGPDTDRARLRADAERECVLEALAGVRDPELDEPITALGFVSSCAVTPEGGVAVGLRLPTPQCAPNFAFLMTADARDAVLRLPWVTRVTVTLEDHYTNREINAAVEHGGGFSGAFPGETDEKSLDTLRELFFRKAFVAREARMCEALLAAGAGAEEVTSQRLADLPELPDTRRFAELRRHLGIPSAANDPAFVLPDGNPIRADDLKRWLRTAALVRMSLEVNGGICRSLLNIRHGTAPEDPEEPIR
jgi:metal-sulfur cluster biosynthetic enzyme